MFVMLMFIEHLEKHFRSKKQIENEKQSEMITPEGLFEEEQAPTKNKIKIYTSLKH